MTGDTSQQRRYLTATEPKSNFTSEQQARVEALYVPVYECVGYEGTSGYLPGYKVGFLDGLRSAAVSLEDALCEAEEYAAIPLDD